MTTPVYHECLMSLFKPSVLLQMNAIPQAMDTWDQIVHNQCPQTPHIRREDVNGPFHFRPQGLKLPWHVVLSTACRWCLGMSCSVQPGVDALACRAQYSLALMPWHVVLSTAWCWCLHSTPSLLQLMPLLFFYSLIWTRCRLHQDVLSVKEPSECFSVRCLVCDGPCAQPKQGKNYNATTYIDLVRRYNVSFLLVWGLISCVLAEWGLISCVLAEWGLISCVLAPVH